jgi:hypothetical protein
LKPEIIKQSIKTIKNNIDKLKRKKKLKPHEVKRLKESEEKLVKRLDSLEIAEVSPEYRITQKKKADLLFDGHAQYICSPEWTARKNKYYETHRRECRSCGSWEKEIHLHHKTYKRIYNEDDSDLMPLCLDCHASLHLVQKTLLLKVEEATDIWLSCFNKTDQKKKIRAALRGLTHEDFALIWEGRSKIEATPLDTLSRTIKRILRGKPPPKKSVVVEYKRVSKLISMSRNTGNSKGYDAMVDSLMLKLERSH